MSAPIMRFEGECELVWLNNKNALVVSDDCSSSSNHAKVGSQISLL